jgi:hypothetical protein
MALAELSLPCFEPGNARGCSGNRHQMLQGLERFKDLVMIALLMNMEHFIPFAVGQLAGSAG